MKEILRLLDITVFKHGAIAQLVEHLHGMQGASGSSPLGSIYKLLTPSKYSKYLVHYAEYFNFDYL